MAEFAMMLMLMLCKNARYYLDAQKAHQWTTAIPEELTGSTVGIIGLGSSGSDLARKCKAFHMRVLGLRRSDIPCPDVDITYTHERLHEMLAESDFVVVTAPMTPETRGMLSEAEFRVMKRNAYFIVTSRGGIAQDEALLKALREGWIAGAGLDDHIIEPLPPDSPFWSLPNVIVTPHIGAGGHGGARRAMDVFLGNLRRYIRGEEMLTLVDKKAGY